MKTSDKIFVIIWYLPSLGFGYLTLSSELCGLNNWCSAFISFWIFIVSVAFTIKTDSYEARIENLEKKITELQKSKP